MRPPRVVCVCRAFCWAVTLAGISAGFGQQVSVVNIIPKALSNEVNQDSEPNLAVSPSNPSFMAASALTPGVGVCGLNLAPIFVSSDAGTTWQLSCVIPSDEQGKTNDITLSFSPTSANTLYAGILRRPGDLRINVLRTSDFPSPTAMTVLADRSDVRGDQPYVASAAIGGTDRLVYGGNVLGLPNARTATINSSADAGSAAPAFDSVQIDTRDTPGQDGPGVRPAIHADGTVYAIFYGWREDLGSALKSDVVVVRNDPGNTGAAQFTDLIDSDGLSGKRVVEARVVPWENSCQANFGQERFVSANVSIAVDPRSSATVYIAWADRVGTQDYTLHVRRSTDRGVTWSADLKTVTNATNPALAVNSDGVVGFMYQQISGTGSSSRWTTHMLLTSNAFGTVRDVVLSKTPAQTPICLYSPYLGDYIHLTAVDQTFFGVFSANNTPDRANFPSGVAYQRNANFTTKKLRNADNTGNVAISIDPFFVRVKP